MDTAASLNDKKAPILRTELGFSNYKKGSDELMNYIKDIPKCSH